MAKYGSYAMEAAQDEQKAIDSESGEFVKIKQGRNVFRFLPPPVGVRSPFIVAYQHFIDVPGAESSVRFVCPRMMKVHSCPACQHAEKLRGTGNPSDKEFADRLFPRRRVYANVIDRQEPDKGPQIIAFPKMVHEKLLALRMDPDAGGDFTDPKDGFDIVIERTGMGKNTKYDVFPSRRQTPLGNLDWLDQQHDLARYATARSQEEIMNLLSGIASGTTGGAVKSGGGRGQKKGEEDDDNPFTQ